METCKKQRVSIDWVPMWEESLCSSAREREKRNMKCFPGSSVLNRGYKTSTRRTPTAFSDWRLPADVLFWTQPGVASTWGAWDHPGPDAIASTAVLVGRGCISAPVSPISVHWTSPRQTYGSHHLSWSGSEVGSSATLNQHGWLQSAQIWPSYQLLFQDISSS